jgi:hypothetical protein
VTVKLHQELISQKSGAGQEISRESAVLLAKASRLYYAVSAMGVLLFVLMIFKNG